MRALLIHADGRPEVIEGTFGSELTLIAVLSQAAMAALDESAIHAQQPVPSHVQMNLGERCITILRMPESCWLRVEHEAAITIAQLQDWALPWKTKSAENISKPAPSMTLMDALNFPPI